METPRAEPNRFEPEIASIKATYARFEQQGLARTRWAPLSENEADVRAQQMLTFSEMMRAAGILHLDGLRILDLGCGTGRQLRQFLDMGASPESVFGIDLDEAALSRARLLSPNVCFASSTGDRIDFADATFDLVTHFFVFSSVPNEAFRAQLAQEVRRVLKPGGLFFWWDMLHMAEAAGGLHEPLDARAFFSREIIAEQRLGPKPRPSSTFRASRWRRLLTPLADRLEQPHIFQAALIRNGGRT